MLAEKFYVRPYERFEAVIARSKLTSIHDALEHASSYRAEKSPFDGISIFRLIGVFSPYGPLAGIALPGTTASNDMMSIHDRF